MGGRNFPLPPTLMSKIATLSEEQKVDSTLQEKRVTKNYLSKKFRHRKKRQKRPDVRRRRRRKSREGDKDLKPSSSESKDMKMASFGENPVKSIIIKWLLRDNLSIR